MVDRAAARIVIGGLIPRSQIERLVTAIADDGAGPDWGDVFEDRAAIAEEIATQLGPFRLFGESMPGGAFREIEAACDGLGLSHKVTWDGCSGAWAPGFRVVELGRQPVTVPLDADGGNPCLTAGMIREQGPVGAAELLALLRRYDNLSPGQLIAERGPKPGQINNALEERR